MIENESIYLLSNKKRNDFRKLNISYITQDVNVINSMTVLENICMPTYVIKKHVDEKTVDNAIRYMKMLGIEEYAETKPLFLSGGEVRRVEIARALTTNTPYIIADEPTSSLDKDNTEIVINALRHYKENGGTVIVSTHDYTFLKEADKVFSIKDTFVRESCIALE